MHSLKLRALGVTLVVMLAACSSSPGGSSLPSTNSGTSGSTGISGSGNLGGTSKASLTGPAFLFSPYKDVGVNLGTNSDGTNDVIATDVTGTYWPVPLISTMPSGNTVMTLNTAIGQCGSELWLNDSLASSPTVTGPQLVSANMSSFVSAGKKYIISAGGTSEPLDGNGGVPESGPFTCPTTTGFLSFIKQYYTPNMVGVDFQVGQNIGYDGFGSYVAYTQTQIDQLITDAIAAVQVYPTMRFTFTIGTSAPTAAGVASLSGQNLLVVNELKRLGMTNYNSNYAVNLMAMNYRVGTTYPDKNPVYPSPNPNLCAVSNGQCEMGQSAVQAARDLNSQYGIPFSNIEVTAATGWDENADTFTLSDVDTLAAFAKQNGLAGLHIWAYDRDDDCGDHWMSPVCSNVTGVGTLGYTNRFISDLGL